MAETTPTTALVIQRLRELPRVIETAEHRVLEMEANRREVEETLRAKQFELLTTGAIDGKNEETRKAQLLRLTMEERDVLDIATQKVALERIALERLQNEFSAEKVIGRILAGQEVTRG